MLSSLLQRSTPVLQPVVAARYASTDRRTFNSGVSSSAASRAVPRPAVVATAKVVTLPPPPPVTQYRTQALHTSSWDDWGVVARSTQQQQQATTAAVPQQPPTQRPRPVTAVVRRAIHTGRLDAAACTAACGQPASASRARVIAAAATEGTASAASSYSVAPAPAAAAPAPTATGRLAASHGGCAPSIGQARRFTLRGNTQGSSRDVANLTFASFSAPRVGREGAAPARQGRRHLVAPSHSRRTFHAGVPTSKPIAAPRALRRRPRTAVVADV